MLYFVGIFEMNNANPGCTNESVIKEHRYFFKNFLVFEAKSLRLLPEDLQERKNLSEMFAPPS
jgi:hypothetical protein